MHFDLVSRSAKFAGTEDEAFWTWAVIETLRHSGVRVEELLEITQLAIVSYRLFDTGRDHPAPDYCPASRGKLTFALRPHRPLDLLVRRS